MLRLRKLLQTANEDTIFTGPSETRTIHVPIPDFGDSWPQYHAAVGSYHVGEAQATKKDLTRLLSVWKHAAPETSLSEASWIPCGITEANSMLNALTPRMLDLYFSGEQPRTSMGASSADNEQTF